MDVPRPHVAAGAGSVDGDGGHARTLVSGSDALSRNTWPAMPTYTYRCTKCGHEFERFQSMSDEPVKRCEKCKSKVQRVFHPVGIAFKGSVFHKTDYRSSSKKSSTRDSSSSSESSSDKKKSDSKSDSAPTSSESTSSSSKKSDD